jgi:hypothetical protein
MPNTAAWRAANPKQDQVRRQKAQQVRRLKIKAQRKEKAADAARTLAIAKRVANENPFVSPEWQKALAMWATYWPKYTVASSGQSVMILAMQSPVSPNPAASSLVRPQPDHARCSSLRSQGLPTATVSLLPRRPGKVGHTCVDFKHNRGIKTLLQLPAPKVLLLDYFWLQKGYYKSNYGDNWPAKVSLLFNCSQWANLAVVILPIGVDFDDAMWTQMEEMKTREATANHFVMTNEEAMEWHPLVAHTVKVDAELHAMGNGRHHEVQITRCDGFCVIMRCGLDRESCIDMLTRLCGK